MISFEKFKDKNKDILKKIIENNLHSLNQNFLEVYEKSKTIDKYILRNNLYLFKYEDIYVGYLWSEKIDLNEYRIIDMYVKLDYIEFFKINQLSKLKDKMVIYEGIENYENSILTSINMFYKVKSVKLLKKILCNFEVAEDSRIKFEKFKIGKDEDLRVNLQNKIFHNINRTPINKMDIKFEQNTINYLEEFSIFEYLDDIPIGYAQIIKKNNKYVLVNFGVIKDFRGYGLGEKLLKYMCKIAKEHKINNIYIYVDNDNYVALNLYRKMGFLEIAKVATWIKD
ncbi:MAG: GNAT family N-acetyltransferase [Clostridium sp.]|uniref:GNAT family N-acetyltransferase n=1 Tax=Clostridium sp. TaxID=1506 RepID=UPI003F378586